MDLFLGFNFSKKLKRIMQAYGKFTTVLINGRGLSLASEAGLNDRS